ncbi:MAG: gluconate kinase [Fibrobacteria bacterium]|jgi:gluconokinase|nr:gluconate kinase [Fibrobacteria bacterium]
MILVLAGVSGSGKTTMGRRLAERLGIAFEDADDFHPEANIEKIRTGRPLTDADRSPWLSALSGLIAGWSAGGTDAVLACSALKRAYRDALAGGLPDVRFAILDVPPKILRERLEKRAGHFMPASLLPSQLATLEISPAEPNVFRVDASGTAGETVEKLRREFFR